MGKSIWKIIRCKKCHESLALLKTVIRHAEGEIWCPYCEISPGNPGGVLAFKIDVPYGEKGELKIT